DKRQYSFMFGILLDLRYNTSFSKFHWVRQLLERGIKPACDEAINFLINLFLQGTPLRVQEYYRELSAWLPETGRTYERYSEANKYCFAVMVLFYENSFDKQTYQVGEWPPSYQVFALLDNSENSIADFWIPKL